MNRRDNIKSIHNQIRSQQKAFDKVDRFERNFAVMFGLILLGNLIFFGVVIWAVIELVQWVTTK